MNCQWRRTGLLNSSLAYEGLASMTFVIRTKYKSGRRTLYYDGISWQPGFPQMYASRTTAEEDLKELKKKYRDIEVVPHLRAIKINDVL